MVESQALLIFYFLTGFDPFDPVRTSYQRMRTHVHIVVNRDGAARRSPAFKRAGQKPSFLQVNFTGWWCPLVDSESVI